MIKLEPIFPEEIEKIKAEYAEKIAKEPDESLKKIIEIECDSTVTEAIGRQRAEAIAKGGPLAEKIKAENAAALEELQKQMTPEMLAAMEEARKRQAELNEMISRE